jgi:hypothetical protein
MEDPKLNLRDKVIGTARFVHTPEFREWAVKHKGVVRTAISLIEEIDQKVNPILANSQTAEEARKWALKKDRFSPISSSGQPFYIGEIFKKDGVEVSLERVKESRVYKVKTIDGIFFVKKEIGLRDNLPIDIVTGGPHEVISSAKVKEALRDEHGVEIIDFQLGFEEKQKQVRYFVARWQKGNPICLETYLDSIEDKQELQRLMFRLDNIKSVIRHKLGGAFDLRTYNMFYDKEEDKIILFDLHLFDFHLPKDWI